MYLEFHGKHEFCRGPSTSTLTLGDGNASRRVRISAEDRTSYALAFALRDINFWLITTKFSVESKTDERVAQLEQCRSTHTPAAYHAPSESLALLASLHTQRKARMEGREGGREGSKQGSIMMAS